MMKYTISDENKYTTLSAYAENKLFYGYHLPDWLFVYSAKGLYPEHQSVNSIVQVKIKPDYKHITPEEWEDIINELQDWEQQQIQGEIINVFKEEARKTYFGDTKEQEQVLYRSIRKGLADMYDDGYNDGKYNFDKDYSNLQGRYEFMLDACLNYMRVVLNNREGKL